MPPAQKPAGAEGAERALPREQPVTADAATPTPANKGSASAAGAEVITMGNDDLLAAQTPNHLCPRPAAEAERGADGGHPRRRR